MKPLLSHFFLFLFVILFHYAGVGQTEQVIKGNIKNKANQENIIGAFVSVVGTSYGGTTDVDGDFSFTLPSLSLKNAVIEVTSIGFRSLTFVYDGQPILNLLLEDMTLELQEVVVTSSYGTSKSKEDLSSSLQTISAEDLQVTQAVESFDKMLDGVASGVIISAPSKIGGAVKIDIRGQGSLTPLTGSLVGTSTQPLIIIDGVVMSEEAGFDNEIFDGSGSISEEFKNPLSKISPEDIESISILKDAAAVGLYGADAANGVIIIKTKKSRNKKPSFSFSNQIGVSKAINKIQYLSGQDFYDIKKEYRLAFGDSEQQASLSAGRRDVNTNWFDLLNKNGSFQRYSINASFGKGIWNFRTSFNVLQNNEAQIKNDFVRLGWNINFGFVSKKWSSQWVISPSYIIQNSPNNLFSFAYPSNLEYKNADGSYAEFGYNQIGNPVAVANQNMDIVKTLGGIMSWNLAYQITNKLKLSSIIGFDKNDKIQKRYFSAENESGRYNGIFIKEGVTFPNWGRRLDFFRNNQRWNQSTQLFYESSIKNHHFDAILGFELQKETVEAQRLLGTGFTQPNLLNEADQAASYSNNTIFTQNARISSISQFNYDFDKKYYLVINLRRDASSSFGGDVDPAINGGIGCSWNINKESFLKSVDKLDLLKCRLSYGVTGNSRIGPYRSLGLYNQDLLTGSGYNGNGYAVPSTAPNQNLSWERNYKLNAGVDVVFLKRYKATIDYFFDQIKDQIVSREVPPETGFRNLQINGAAMINKGLEFSLSAEWIKKSKLSWKTNFNINTLSNKVTNLLGLGSSFSSSERARAQKVGFPTSAIWGIKSGGIDPATGRELFMKGGQLYDAATYSNLFEVNDWEVIGNSQPSLYGGIQNNFSFYGFTLGLRGSFRWGEDVLIQDDLISKYTQLENRNLSSNALDRWRKLGDLASHPAASPYQPIFPNSSRFLYDASHFKLQNINLSYVLTNFYKFKSANIYVDISNVAYFYRSTPSGYENGIAQLRFTYPEAMTITTGLQFNF
jgi:TonB-dependent starch-binding outer membrane protein SusC